MQRGLSTGGEFLAGLLTKRFIDLIKQAVDGVVDLNKAAETLQVSEAIKPMFLVPKSRAVKCDMLPLGCRRQTFVSLVYLLVYPY